MQDSDRNDIKQIKIEMNKIAANVERITFELTRVEQEGSRFDEDRDDSYRKNKGLFSILNEINRSLHTIGLMLVVLIVLGLVIVFR